MQEASFFASLEDYLQNVEQRLLQNLHGSLQSTRKVAKLLNVVQATVVRKLQRYDITKTLTKVRRKHLNDGVRLFRLELL